jgi:hypothetical protein
LQSFEESSKPSESHQFLPHNISLFLFVNMSFTKERKQQVLATASAQPSLLQQVGMAGAAAVFTVTFIHPIDVVKVSFHLFTLLF